MIHLIMATQCVLYRMEQSLNVRHFSKSSQPARETPQTLTALLRIDVETVTDTVEQEVIARRFQNKQPGRLLSIISNSGAGLPEPGVEKDIEDRRMTVAGCVYTISIAVVMVCFPRKTRKADKRRYSGVHSCVYSCSFAVSAVSSTGRREWGM